MLLLSFSLQKRKRPIRQPATWRFFSATATSPLDKSSSNAVPTHRFVSAKLKCSLNKASLLFQSSRRHGKQKICINMCTVLPRPIVQTRNLLAATLQVVLKWEFVVLCKRGKYLTNAWDQVTFGWNKCPKREGRLRLILNLGKALWKPKITGSP